MTKTFFLLVIDHEVVRKDFVLDIAVLVLCSFRNDVAVLNKQLSPSVVLLDPRIYKRHRNLLRKNGKHFMLMLSI